MKKLLNYKTLMTLLAIIVVILQLLMTVFKLNINIDAVVSISIALVGALVTIGIVKKNKEDKTIENKEDLEDLLGLSNNETKVNEEESKIEKDIEKITSSENK